MQVDEWSLCGKTSRPQLLSALHRDDIAALSDPEMIHGACTSQGTLKTGKPIGVTIIFDRYGTIATNVYTPSVNADPNTNPKLRQFPVEQR